MTPSHRHSLAIEGYLELGMVDEAIRETAESNETMRKEQEEWELSQQALIAEFQKLNPFPVATLPPTKG